MLHSQSSHSLSGLGLRYATRPSSPVQVEPVVPSKSRAHLHRVMTDDCLVTSPRRLNRAEQTPEAFSSRVFALSEAQETANVFRALHLSRENPEKLHKVLSDLVALQNGEGRKHLSQPAQKFLIEQLARFVHFGWKQPPPELLEKMALLTDPDEAFNYSELSISKLVDEGEEGRLNNVLHAIRRPKQLHDFTMALLETLPSSEALWQWSQKVEKLTALQDKPRIEVYSRGMKETKKIDRGLNDYVHRLHIPQAQLRNLSGKSLCLIGGGYSPIKAGLRDQRIDCEVTNIDPICTEHDADNEDRKLSLNFFDEPVKNLLKREPFDEMWALNSLPQYAFSPEETVDFYSRALNGLKQDGVLRVAPTHSFMDHLSPAMALSRPLVSDISQHVLSELEKRPDLFRLEAFEVAHKSRK